jgi:hypothetical protein
MTTVETIHAVYVKLDNRPGSLERAARALGEKRVNIDAISLETVGSTGFARIVTHKGKETLRVLHAAGLEAYESDTLLVSLPNKPGELARATAEVAAAGVNVEAVTTTADGRLAVRTSDNERAAAILRKL